MTLRRAQLGIIACAGGVGANVHGQVGGEATWLWDVTTQDGDAVVEPGETATVTLSIDYAPDAGPQGPVLGLAATVFDTVGGPNAANGVILGWEVLNQLDLLSGDTTTSDGVSLFGTNAGQLPIDPGLNHDDPLGVLMFEWAPRRAGSYEVEYATLSYLELRDHVIYVWEGDSDDTAELFMWPIEEAAIAFQVVPEPGCIGAFSLAAVMWGRRRRT